MKNRMTHRMKRSLQKIKERLDLERRQKLVGDRLDMEREWLADLIKLTAAKKALYRLLDRLRGSPSRLRAWVGERLDGAVGYRPAVLTAPPQTWILRAIPVLAVGMLLLAVYHRVPEHTTFEPFDIFTTAPRQHLLVVHHSADTFGQLAYENSVQALEYAHLSHESLDLATTTAWPDLSHYSAILLVTELLPEIDPAQAERISTYVADGGGLVVVYRGWNPDLTDLFGFTEVEGRPALLPDSEGGLIFHTNLFPGVEGLVLGSDTANGHVPYDVAPQPDAQIIASSATDRPLAWLRRHKQGRVLFWNTAMLASKNTRGLIVQSVANVQRVTLLPIANVATVQIDDFPAGFADEHLEPVASEYDLSTLDFYSQVWYPDMIKIARSYGLAYTFLIPFNYNDRTTPPFDFQQWEQATISLDGQEMPYGRYATHIATQRDEIGLHGYNHLPLTLKNWGSRDKMMAALEATARQWETEDLGDLPTTYVPPHNRYDEAGAQSLTKAMPSLKIISGLYNSGLFEEGGNREFGPEPWNPDLFAIPRATSGYNMDAGQRFSMLSELGTMGVWTHFLHADDIFETPENMPETTGHRNPEGWLWRGDHSGQQNGFYYRFRRWLNFVQEHYPWLRYVETTEARALLQTYLANDITVDLKPYAISLQSTDPTFFQVRINDDRRINLNTLDGAQFIHLYEEDGYKIYTMRAVRETVHLQLLIPKVDEVR